MHCQNANKEKELANLTAEVNGMECHKKSQEAQCENLNNMHTQKVADLTERQAHLAACEQDISHLSG